METFDCILIQRYDVPSKKVGSIFIGIFYVELNRVRARKWNSEGVIVFQSVIPKRAQGVNNSKHIRERVLF